MHPSARSLTTWTKVVLAHFTKITSFNDTDTAVVSSQRNTFFGCGSGRQVWMDLLMDDDC